MFYKNNANAHGRTGSTYYTYGNPGYDKTGGRGDWTYINWSWVQNGAGPEHPQNKTSGGGIVRAMAKRDMIFTACDVQPVIGYSYGQDNQVNGRVTAFYGKTFAGPGNRGSAIYGWLPHSYQKNADIIVPCIRRSEPASNAQHAEINMAPSSDRMERMARNLLSEIAVDAKQRTKLLDSFGSEPDPQARMERITELSRMDDPATVDALLALLAKETEPRVREQIIVVIGFMRTTPREMTKGGPAMLACFGRSKDTRERLRMLDVMSNIPAAEAVEFVVRVRRTLARDQAEHSATTDAMLKLIPRMKIDPTLEAEVRREIALRTGKTRTHPAE
jgi:hypothetical protein